jgi:hypothetical protein
MSGRHGTRPAGGDWRNRERHPRLVTLSGRTAGLRAARVLAALSVTGTVLRADTARPRTFATADEAVRALTDTLKAGDLAALVALFGPEAQDLVDRSDRATGRWNREVLAVIAVLRTYVGAQRICAHTGHDGKSAGLYAGRLGSDPGT